MVSDDPKYRCFCGQAHVRKGSLVVAWIIIVISVLAFIASFFFGWVNLFPQILMIVISVLVIYGNRQEKSWMFIPFLIIVCIYIIIYLIFAGYLLVVGIILPRALLDSYDSYSKSLLRSSLITWSVIMFIISLMYIYFWIIVFRAFQFIKHEIEPRKYGTQVMVYANPEGGQPQVFYTQQPAYPHLGQYPPHVGEGVYPGGQMYPIVQQPQEQPPPAYDQPPDLRVYDQVYETTNEISHENHGYVQEASETRNVEESREFQPSPSRARPTELNLDPVIKRPLE